MQRIHLFNLLNTKKGIETTELYAKLDKCEKDRLTFEQSSHIL